MPAEAVPKLLLGRENKGRNPVTEKSKAASTTLSGQNSATGKLKVCIMKADFWGLKAAGGTATAYHLLAAALAKEESLQVVANVSLDVQEPIAL